MSEEPFYIRQCSKPKTDTQRDDWFKGQADIARAQGALWYRFSFHPRDENRTIIEAWKARPKREGMVRWQVTSRDDAEAMPSLAKAVGATSH